MGIDRKGFSPRVATGVGLLAILPALWYGFGRPSRWGFVTVLSVLIIVASLYIAMKPVAQQQASEPPNAV